MQQKSCARSGAELRLWSDNLEQDILNSLLSHVKQSDTTGLVARNSLAYGIYGGSKPTSKGVREGRVEIVKI